MSIFRLLPAFLLSLFLATAAGQDKPEPVTTKDPEIPVAHLDLLLDPLTKSDLEVEVEAWQSLVKESVTALSRANIASKSKAEGDEEVGEKTISELQDEKTKRLTRFKTVLDAYEKKGGDPGEYRTYAAAVNGVKLDVGDAGASFSVIRGWLTSEDGGILLAKKLGIFLAIMLVAWIVSRPISKVVAAAVDRQKGASVLLRDFIKKLTGRVIVVIGFIIGLSSLGVNVGAMLALIGGASLIIGLAMQDALSNFANGMMLLLYRPFDVGDVVEVGGTNGIVDSVSLVNTRIKTFDNQLVLVPNKDVWGQTITNATALDTRRVDLTFGISYHDDLDQAQAILEKIISGHELVLADPAPTIRVNELADSSVNFIARPWVKTADLWTVYWDVTKKVKEEFDAAGITIPFPQQDVHLHQLQNS